MCKTCKTCKKRCMVKETEMGRCLCFVWCVQDVFFFETILLPYDPRCLGCPGVSVGCECCFWLTMCCLLPAVPGSNLSTSISFKQKLENRWKCQTVWLEGRMRRGVDQIGPKQTLYYIYIWIIKYVYIYIYWLKLNGWRTFVCTYVFCCTCPHSF